MKKRLKDFLKEPHTIAWIILGLIVFAVFIFFDYFKSYFLKIALIGLLFILFYYIDGLLFNPVAKRAKDIFSGNLFVKRWKAFPIFLLEIYLIYFLSSFLENQLNLYLSPEKLSHWYVLIWIGIMYLFYYFKGSGD